MALAERSARRAEFDWLRIVAIGLMMLFHSCLGFSSWPWHVNDPHRSVLLGEFLSLRLARYLGQAGSLVFLFAALIVFIFLVLGLSFTLIGGGVGAAAADRPVQLAAMPPDFVRLKAISLASLCRFSK